ncbi:hypothetical protein GCM10027080_24920 [Pedococcus soli]
MPAVALGVHDDGAQSTPQTPYCAGCAQALILAGEFVVTEVLDPDALGSVVCPDCGGAGRIQLRDGALKPLTWSSSPSADDQDDMTHAALMRWGDGVPATAVGESGRWRVWTETARYDIDLNDRTIRRQPAQPGAGEVRDNIGVAQLRRDNEITPLLGPVDCRLGEPMTLRLGLRSDGCATLRLTTIVTAIEQVVGRARR